MLTTRTAQPPEFLLRHEGALVTALFAVVLVAIPLTLGYVGLSWDALNHHIYLGWVADRPRFDQDYMAASYQSYQFPYLYWPVYKLAMADASGRTAGAALALIHALAVPPVWMMVRACIPGQRWPELAFRFAGVLLAFLNGVVLSMFDSTANDLMASIPLLWSIALGVQHLHSVSTPVSRVSIGLSGLMAGAALAFKLSNAPIVVVLPLLWVWGPGGMTARLQRCVLAGAAAVAGLALIYGHWGWQLWVHFGNPIFPLYDNWFAGLRELSGWTR